jgi:hypothetical protein
LANGTAITSTISTEVTQTTGGDDPDYPLNGGDTLVITPSGSVVTSSSPPTIQPGVVINGNSNTVNNSGAINTSGGNSSGIIVNFALGAESSNNIINNYGAIQTQDTGALAIESNPGAASNTYINWSSGLIRTFGGAAAGILARGPSNTITNLGNIMTMGPSSSGVSTPDGNSSITNYGLISTEGVESFGIEALGGSSLISNSGAISTSGELSPGIYATGISNILINSGSISAAGESADGINTLSGYNKIYNSGSIQGLGLNGIGISTTADYNTIVNSGSISTAGEEGYGIKVDGSSNLITNSGSISTAGVAGFGIYTRYGDFNAITNSGSINSSGQYGYGILTSGDYISMASSGAIATAGEASVGIAAYGNSNKIVNSGSISTVGAKSFGVFTARGSNAITNSGSISTRGEEAFGIYIGDELNTAINSGSIRTTGNNAHGLAVAGSINAITNSGSISTFGDGAKGIYALGDSNTVTNSGSIVSAKSYAIYFDGTGNTLNVLNNFLGGGIDMGSGGTVNITTGANYSKLFTFEGTGLTITGSGPIPLFINQATQQAATYDPTIFASSTDALADMTNTISSMIPGRFNGMDRQHPIWAQGFGMTSNYSGTSATLDRKYVLSGVAMGYDAKRSKDLTLGILGGYGQTSLTADSKSTQSFNNTSDGGFLGLYGQKRWGDTSVDFALYGGVQSFQQQRYVNDNLAYLGNSSTNASNQGWWIAPEAGITIKAGEIQGWSVLPTARLRYAQQWMGSYRESGGGSANATVNGRNVSIGQSFVGIGTKRTLKTSVGKNTKMVLEGQVGYMYRGVVGDDTVSVTMIGQSLSLPTETSSRNAVAVSAGVTVDLSSAVSLKIRGDAAAGNGINYVGGGWAGLSVKF